MCTAGGGGMYVAIFLDNNLSTNREQNKMYWVYGFHSSHPNPPPPAPANKRIPSLINYNL